MTKIEQSLGEFRVLDEDRLNRKFMEEILLEHYKLNPLIYEFCRLQKWVEYTRLN